MKQNRRTFLNYLFGFCLGGLLGRTAIPRTIKFQTTSDDNLKNKLLGSWKLQSYSYTSNKNTYTSPDEIEASASFKDANYEVKFSTHISRAGIKSTRNASESGTFSLSENRIRLFAEEASEDKEKGEEFLTEVQIEGVTMTLASNNGSNREVWKRYIESGN